MTDIIAESGSDDGQDAQYAFVARIDNVKLLAKV